MQSLKRIISALLIRLDSIARTGCLMLACLGLASLARADAPPLRAQISLNGEWAEGGVLPLYTGQEVTAKVYAREVAVPAAWAGKVIKLEFGAVNFSTEIFINEQKVGEHIGGWVPFSVDVTGHVRPGVSFRLGVAVKGRRQAPYVDAKGRALWPMGDVWTAAGDDLFGGIVDDVWLRAYGVVHIEDAWIRTSVRKKEMILEYTLRNTGDREHRVSVSGTSERVATHEPGVAFTSPAVSLAPGEQKALSVTVPWPNPELWRPGRPELYHLVSRVMENGVELDRETRRFGFRELWIEGNQFRLNGIRFNLRSDFVEYGQDWPAWAFERKNWPAVIDRLQGLNLNSFRTHKYPAPCFVYDLADEQGLVMIAESAVNGDAKGFMRQLDRAAYLRNAETWTTQWVKGARNHASILFWTSGNELYNSGFGGIEARRLAAAIRANDPTHPILHEGLKDVGDECVSYHYPSQGKYPFNGEPWNREAGVYVGWRGFIRADKPVCAGECLNVPGRMAPVPSERRNIWWHGIWPRGMRYQNWAQISPGELLNWVLKESDPNDIKIRNVRNAYAPVALFDKDYDNLGIAPLTQNGVAYAPRWPEVESGTWLEHNLVLYNDEFEEENIQAEAVVMIDGKQYAAGRCMMRVSLGNHEEIPCRLQVPNVGEKTMELILRTYKGGKLRFEEPRLFKIRAGLRRGATSDKITIGGNK